MLQTNQYYDTGILPDPLPQLLGLLLLLAALGWFGLRPILRSRRYQTGHPERPATVRQHRTGYHPQAARLDASRLPDPPRSDLADPKVQMEAIARVDFKTQPLLNASEARLLPVLEKAVRDFGSGHRLMAQTSLGEVIRPVATSPVTGALHAAYASINSKRLDFAVINRFGHIVAAIEYQGAGHYQNNAFLRDAVKREAVRKAGIPYIEVAADFDAAEIRARLRRILTPVSDNARP